MLYSKSTNGFYDPIINVNNIPDDAVEITTEQWQSLLVLQSEGQVIHPDINGNPAAEPTPQFTLSQLQENQIAILKSSYQNAISSAVSYTNQAGIKSTYNTTTLAINGQSNISNLQECINAGESAWTLGVWSDSNGIYQTFTYEDLQGLAASIAMVEIPDWKNLALKIAQVQSITDSNPANPSTETIDAISSIAF